MSLEKKNWNTEKKYLWILLTCFHKAFPFISAVSRFLKAMKVKFVQQNGKDLTIDESVSLVYNRKFY